MRLFSMRFGWVEQCGGCSWLDRVLPQHHNRTCEKCEEAPA